MTLDQQIATLTKDAPSDPRLRAAIERAVAPVLRETIASQLQHLEYQILQSSDRGDWVVTTLAHRQHPDRQKKVIYAFATLESARTFLQEPHPQAIAVAMPVVQLLFRLLSLEVDSIIFFETPGEFERGIEVERSALQARIHQQLHLLARSRTELA